MALDEIDLKILKELERNARLPIAKIAHRVSLSRNAVRQRIDRLERDQVITGYTVTLGDEAAQMNTISAYMFIARKDRMRGADVTTAIMNIPEVKTCHIVSGNLDIVVLIEAPSQEKIKEIWKDLAKIPGILDISTSFSLSTVI